MSGNLDAIVQLHHTLADLYAARDRLHGIPDWMRELHDEHESAQAAIAELEVAIVKAREERRAAEGQVEEARELLKRYQKQINEVSTQREYGALLHEIDTVKQQINEGEELALAAMERADAVVSELESTRESSRDLSTRYQQELEKWEAEKPAVAKEVAVLEQRSDELRAELPRGVVRQFDRIAERLEGPPLAAIRRVERPGGRGPTEWHCGQCNYRVRPQVVVEISNSGTIVQCESCKRILYVENEG